MKASAETNGDDARSHFFATDIDTHAAKRKMNRLKKKEQAVHIDLFPELREKAIKEGVVFLRRLKYDKDLATTAFNEHLKTTAESLDVSASALKNALKVMDDEDFPERALEGVMDEACDIFEVAEVVKRSGLYMNPPTSGLSTVLSTIINPDIKPADAELGGHE
jgi:hypothetical protein